jgi:hypothetical protein
MIMKQLTLALIAFAAIAFTTCHSSSNQSSEKKDTLVEAKMDTAIGHASLTGNPSVIKSYFTNVNAQVAACIKGITIHYFYTKHGLAYDDIAESKNGTAVLLKIFSKFDIATFPADQKTVYDGQIGGIKESAQAIVTRADTDGERIQFAELSNHMYELVSASGTCKILYCDHCPMALNNKGANWLNESLDIQNPYFKGTVMNTCGKVEEVIE